MTASFLRRFTKKLLIIINVGIAVFFLLGSYGYLFNPLHFWFVGFFTLGAFYFALLLFGFIIFWLFIKPKLMTIGLIAFILSWGPLKHLIKLRTAQEFSIQKQPGRMRVMSWNVEHFDILEHKTHPEVKKQMIDMINLYQPDVACFQEMVGGDKRPGVINYLPDIIQKLNMSDYHYSFNKKLDFDNDHHFGIIIFSKYPILDKQTVSYPPHDYNSIFQYIDILRGTDTFRVFNIHLQSLKFSGDNLKYIEDPSMETESDLRKSKNVVFKFKIGFLKRKTQSDRIKEELNKSPYPVIVCGDFNDVPNSYAYNRIGKGLKNAFAEKGSGIGRTFNGISPTLRIDNIFVDDRFEVDQFLRIQKKLSDHFPVISDIYLKKQ